MFNKKLKFMLSNSAKYAIKAILYLAVNTSENHLIVISEIAEPINVPKHYIAKLLQNLSKKHIVSSAKGPRGGFYMTQDNRKTTVSKIIEVVDGEERINSCLLSLKECNSANPCSLHHLAFSQKQIILENFKKTTIEDLSNHIKTGKSVLPF